ncbi:unnamed protein product [Tetraodon nigroviridis]|uniref:Chromosome undetermined SCAF10132, whole genome shotgun sequence n=1 Tax=Tetraodon nigroviridis TaxID=99883 RepID=Q4T320_TETNG|nr:unnamed protein product [Tetraodon nigroviridis]
MWLQQRFKGLPGLLSSSWARRLLVGLLLFLIFYWYLGAERRVELLRLGHARRADGEVPPGGDPPVELGGGARGGRVQQPAGAAGHALRVGERPPAARRRLQPAVGGVVLAPRLGPGPPDGVLPQAGAPPGGAAGGGQGRHVVVPQGFGAAGPLRGPGVPAVRQGLPVRAGGVPGPQEQGQRLPAEGPHQQPLRAGPLLRALLGKPRLRPQVLLQRGARGGPGGPAVLRQGAPGQQPHGGGGGGLQETGRPHPGGRQVGVLGHRPVGGLDLGAHRVFQGGGDLQRPEGGGQGGDGGAAEAQRGGPGGGAPAGLDGPLHLRGGNEEDHRLPHAVQPHRQHHPLLHPVLLRGASAGAAAERRGPRPPGGQPELRRPLLQRPRHHARREPVARARQQHRADPAALHPVDADAAEARLQGAGGGRRPRSRAGRGAELRGPPVHREPPAVPGRPGRAAQQLRPAGDPLQPRPDQPGGAAGPGRQALPPPVGEAAGAAGQAVRLRGRLPERARGADLGGQGPHLPRDGDPAHHAAALHLHRPAAPAGPAAHAAPEGHPGPRGAHGQPLPGPALPLLVQRGLAHHPLPPLPLQAHLQRVLWPRGQALLQEQGISRCGGAAQPRRLASVFPSLLQVSSSLVGSASGFPLKRLSGLASGLRAVFTPASAPPAPPPPPPALHLLLLLHLLLPVRLLRKKHKRRQQR